MPLVAGNQWPSISFKVSISPTANRQQLHASPAVSGCSPASCFSGRASPAAVAEQWAASGLVSEPIWQKKKKKMYNLGDDNGSTVAIQLKYDPKPPSSRAAVEANSVSIVSAGIGIFVL
ncbi:hypothetical protein Dimus_006678 [Dionaea muscipula]